MSSQSPGTSRRLTAKQLATRAKRMEIWQHNAFLGHARMMQQQARIIRLSSTATTAAKATALKIEDLAIELALRLKKRAQP